ncbi:MAG: YaaL family protein [Sporomusaceae bacterium]|nr:YaaL family protein [Sporomusaceae bacterium]
MGAGMIGVLQKKWHILKRCCRWKPKENRAILIEHAEGAKKEWLHAQAMYHAAVEPELIDYASYLIKAHETYYMYLLRRIKEGAEENNFDANNDKNSPLIYNKVV